MNKWVAGSMVTAVAVSVVGMIGGWNLVGGSAFLAGVILFGWFVNKFVWVRIPDQEMALVFNVETKAFVRYLLPGRHLLLFPLERLRERLSLTATVVRGKCLRAQTNGGITVTVDWSVTYVINPRTVTWELWPHMARILPHREEQLLRGHGNNIVSQVVSELPVKALTDKGSRGKFERQLRQRLGQRLVPFGFQIFRVIATKIEMPPPVQAALEAAHERQLFAYSEAMSLERLQKAVSRFSDADMERLLQLKQLHEMGQNGVALYVPTMMGVVQSGGRSPDGGQARESRLHNVAAGDSASGADGGQNDWLSVKH